MEKLEILSDEELAQIVAGTDVHRAARERTGMCGCGIFPGTLHLH